MTEAMAGCQTLTIATGLRKASSGSRALIANQTVQRTGASRFAQRQIERHRRLAPVADLCVRPRYEKQLSIPLGAPSLGRAYWRLLPRRLFLSLEEDRCQHVEGVVADEHRQFEDRAPVCG